MLTVAACFVQVGAGNILDLVGIANTCLGDRSPESPVWSAAMVLICSAILTCPFSPGFLGEIMEQFDSSSWYDFGASEDDLEFSRLARMSIAGFMVLSLAHVDGAVERLFRQMSLLETDVPAVRVDGIEALTLPYDKIDPQALWANFQVTYTGTPVFFSPEESFLAMATSGSCSEEPVGFAKYLYRFNSWLGKRVQVEPWSVPDPNAPL